MKKWFVVFISVAMMTAACGDDDDNNGAVNNGTNNGGTNNGGTNNGGTNNGGTNNGGTNNGGTNNGGTNNGGTNNGGTNNGTNNCPSANRQNVSGTASVHPLDQSIDDTLTIADTQLTLEAAGPKLVGNESVLLLEDCSPANTELTPIEMNEASADFMFSQVDVEMVNLGLLGTIDDADAATEDTWVPTVTGLAGGGITEAVTGASAFAISTVAEGTLAQLNGGAAGDLVADGFILGQFVDENSSPIDGVQVVDSNGDPVTEAFYPNAALDGLEQDGDTSPTGLFVIPSGGLKTYTGAKTGLTFTDQQAGRLSGFAFVMFLEGSPE